MKLLLALGGNALLPPKGSPSFDDYKRNVCNTAKAISSVAKTHKVAITHGNGPQVGNLLIESKGLMPLDVLDAETQGQIGYMLQKELRSYMPHAEIVTIVTEIVVSENDPAFKFPSKPVGPFYSTRPAFKEWSVKRIGDGWRRVVPSPKPIEIVQKKSIINAFQNGYIVISCGGGGIPVVKQGKKMVGIEAVIDKDLAGALLAEMLGVDRFVILTDVDGAYSDFGNPGQKLIRRATVKEVEYMLNAREFGEGSMGPKVQAAINFTKRTGKPSVIASLGKLPQAVSGKTGTTIVP